MNEQGDDLLSAFDELKRQRIEKLKNLRNSGVNPYAYAYDRTHLSNEIIEKLHAKQKDVQEVSVAGRIMSMRRMGKASFAHVMDRTGRIQIYIKRDEVGADAYDTVKLLDIGDIVGARGSVFQTKTGAITISVKELTILAKSTRPLPIVTEKIQDDEKVVYDAFQDKEMRYRQRYVDLVVSPDVRRVFILRSKIVSVIRHYLEDKGYLEVETPVLQPLYGGALARPFTTHHNALDVDLYLRIADELYLKRLIVGGLYGVFEIAKDFRNEGMDRDHNPEFTMLEIYVAYQDYTFMMDLTEELMSTICEEIYKSTTLHFQGHEIDLKSAWKRMTYFDSIKEYTGIDLYQKSEEECRKAARKLNIEVEEKARRGAILDEIFGTIVEPKLIQPTFIMDFPLELSPLAKKHRSKEGLVERFEGFIAGKEICNAFSELNDPEDQRVRFEEQAKLKAEGDEEAMLIDEDYIRALEYGMPPAAGIGIGIDRLVMIFTDSASIRDVILFPQMRPE